VDNALYVFDEPFSILQDFQLLSVRKNCIALKITGMIGMRETFKAFLGMSTSFIKTEIFFRELSR